MENYGVVLTTFKSEWTFREDLPDFNASCEQFLVFQGQLGYMFAILILEVNNIYSILIW